MPELPEVEAIRRGIAPEITGRKILAVHVERATSTRPQPPSKLARMATGRTIQCVRRRGKNLLLDLSGGYVIRIHLRMTGHLRTGPGEGRVRFELSGRKQLVFEDMRALGRVHIHTAAELRRLLENLGPEPLSEEFTLDHFLEAARRSRRPAKLFLMDQTHVAGLGNIYAAEVLFRARIGPLRPMNRLGRPRLRALYDAIHSVLLEAVKRVTMSYKSGDSTWAVYGREGEPCHTCGRRIRRIPQGGRSTYYCPHCQR